MQISKEVAEILNAAFTMAKGAHFEYVTPELVLFVICQNKVFAQAFEECGGNIKELDSQLRTYLEENMEPVSAGSEGNPEFSIGMGDVLTTAWISAQSSGREAAELTHMIHAIYGLEESYAVYYMRLQGVEHAELLQELTIAYEEMAYENSVESGNGRGRGDQGGSGHESGTQNGSRQGSGKRDSLGQGRSRRSGLKLESDEDQDIDGYDEEGGDPEEAGEFEEARNLEEPRIPDGSPRRGYWQRYATCLNEELEGVNPLIGREDELERTMQILCRKEKNNPLHIGEPGVGKTAVIYGLARLLNEKKVPEPLQGAEIFSLDLGSLLAGTQYRGDFEKRFKKVMDSISREEKPIVYIDEIHNIIGAGAVNGGSFDISNMLKPYLAAGHIRFIGATTYEEYKKHFEKSKSLVRRFQNIDIKEPDNKECVQILEGLKKNYEEFHGICYEEGVLEYTVEMSAKYISERYLPDKAIDLIDEAGAYRRMHPLNSEVQWVSKELIDEILSKTCHIPKQMVESDETEKLATLEERLKGRVFGQDEAISQAVNAVKFSRAGLLEEGKPLASLLFVGPTGVGKTEIAKSLAEELGIKLVRFDMSEYEEKHAVAKLIGAPAGYVGYEEGGLLTEEIRKNPHAVLLLDEIEKAHPDIYNILLQVMDYATLTDNQGRKADFRNVILIMTSNAGASRIGKPGIGFVEQDIKADVVMEEVKRIFQPEFRNRLNRIVVFRSMSEKMAEQIVDKKLGELQKLLVQKNVKLSVDVKAKDLVKKKGISTEFGAREIERVIQGEIKPLLVDEILFGQLKDGGKCRLTTADGKFKVSISAAQVKSAK
ncbi:MAG: AAA family ATPase [Acetatifactor sp.]|nr:AAA family ATPase [Acetatifactor sp.]